MSDHLTATEDTAAEPTAPATNEPAWEQSLDEAINAAKAAASQPRAPEKTDGRMVRGATASETPAESSRVAVQAPAGAFSVPDEDDLGAQIDSLLDAARDSVPAPPASAYPSPDNPPIKGHAGDRASADIPEPQQLAAIDQQLAEHADLVIADELGDLEAAPAATAPPPATTAPDIPAETDVEPISAVDMLTASHKQTVAPPAEASTAEAAPADTAAPTPTAPDPPPTTETTHAARDRRWRNWLDWRRWFNLDTLRTLCILLSAPIANVTPQTRTLIGLVGLMTLGNACALFVYAMLR